jgi:hypothetical protein
MGPEREMGPIMTAKAQKYLPLTCADKQLPLKHVWKEKIHEQNQSSVLQAVYKWALGNKSAGLACCSVVSKVRLILIGELNIQMSMVIATRKRKKEEEGGRGGGGQNGVRKKEKSN